MRWVFLHAIDDLVPGQRAVGRATFPADLPLFADHFPGWPVVPGVLLAEAMAQLAGKLIGYTVRLQRGDWAMPILSMMNGVKFRKFVLPDQPVTLEAELVALREESAAVRVKARVDARIVAQAEQIFVFNPAPLARADAARLERAEAAELARLWSGFDADSCR
jgi:3-hydroxyacyl-[acyl-carrier-protein] dehydratase